MNRLSPVYAESFGFAVKSHNLFLVVLLLAGFLGATQYSAAQAADGTILGTVVDASGAVLADAAVNITNLDTGESRSLTTNSNGQYIAPGLNIGHYKVRAEAKGFKSGEDKDIALNVADRTRIDFKLEVGNIQETISVEANAVAVQTDTGEVSTVINSEQISELGINGRSLYSLFALTPGASSIQADKGGFTPVSGDSSVSINGQRAGHNLQLLDGGENLDRGGSSGSVLPSVDAIAEFSNLTSNYSAEYGLSSAATITTAIKSGTKTFHASGWEFFRNDALDARNYFNPAPEKVSELRFNVYGFNAGGQVPVFKSHPTFFFYNMEWRSEIDGGLLNLPVPQASAYPDANGAGTGAVIPTSYNGKTLDAVVPTGIIGFGSGCPGGVLPAGIVPGQPFPNNTIPDCLINSNAKALLTAGGKYGGIFPTPNTTGGVNFFGGNNSPTKVREEIARVDHQFSPKFSVFGHWISEQISQTYGTTQWSGDNVPSIADVFGNPSYSAVVHTTYVISPTLLNEAAFNYNGNRIHIIPNGLVTAPSGFTFNRLFSGPNADTRIPSINLNGITGSNYTSNWTPWNNKADDYQLRDDLAWTRGAHQLKFGFSWALYKKAQDAFANTQGNFNFNGSYTSPSGCAGSSTVSCGYDFADYLLGLGQQYTEDAVKITGQWNNISLGAYVQDNWRVTPRLTLNLGLRWDGIPHTYEAKQQSSNFYPNLYNPGNAATFDANGNICSTNSVPACAGGPSPGLSTSPNPILAGVQFYTNGIGVGGKNGIPKGLVNDSWANFGPRLGFSYDLSGQGKTVLRGGFGIMYERIQGNDVYNGAVNPPGDLSPTLNNVSLSNPGFNFSKGNTITPALLPVLPLNVTGISKHYPAPVSYQYSFGVQQALGNRAVLGLTYVGSESRHENYYAEINLPPLADVPQLVANNGNLNNGTSINQLFTYTGYHGIRLAENGANANYNSLQFDLHGNVRKDLQLQFGYTYSRAIDEVGSAGNSGGDLSNLTNPYVGPSYDRGPSNYDRTHVAFLNFVYQVPFFRDSSNHLMKALAGGWEVSGIITAESGAPLNLGVNGSNAASVIPNDGGSSGNNSGNRPNIIAPISYPKTPGSWFNPASFAAPACQTGPDCWGNFGFDGLRGPGRDNWNLSLLKNFAITERLKMQFRVESFNVWNHTQFKGDANNGGISLNQGASNFGAITGAFDPRVFQLGLKVSY